jgi:hypothetical protein
MPDVFFADKSSTEVTGRFFEVSVINDDQTEEVVFGTIDRSIAEEACRRLVRIGQTAIVRGVE